VVSVAAGGRDAAEVAVLETVAVAFEADDVGVVDEASRLAAVVCSGRNRPQDSKGQWLAMPRARRS